MALVETRRPVKTASLTAFALRLLRFISKRKSPEEIVSARTRRAEARHAVDRLL